MLPDAKEHTDAGSHIEPGLGHDSNWLSTNAICSSENCFLPIEQMHLFHMLMLTKLTFWMHQEIDRTSNRLLSDSFQAVRTGFR